MDECTACKIDECPFTIPKGGKLLDYIKKYHPDLTSMYYEAVPDYAADRNAQKKLNKK